jgi:hypothetical protein
MKSILTTRVARFRALELHREDLDLLIHIFRENSHNVRISDRQNEYDTLEEMQDKVGKTVGYLEIRSFGPDVRLGFGSGFKVVNDLRTVDVNDPAGESLFLKISDLLEPKQRSTIDLLPILPMMLAAGGLAGAVYSAKFHQPVPEPHSAVLPLVVGFGIGIAAWLSSNLLSSSSSKNRIYLTKRSESPTYWERAGDDLIGRLVTGLLALIVGYILGRHTH